MRNLLLVILLLGKPLYASEAPIDRTTAVATVQLAIHGAGHARLQQLLNHDGVRWSLELGSELLLGVDEAQLASLRLMPEYLAEPGKVALADLMISGHSCGDVRSQVWALVGGYDVMRIPAALQRYQQLVHPSLHHLADVRSVDDRHIRYATAQINQAQQASKRAANALTDAIVARVNPDRWFQTMSDLAAFNRNSYSTGLISARDWIAQRFSNASLSTSNFNYMLASSCNPTPTTLPNIIGTKLGLATPNEWIIVGGHYDARNPSLCDGSMNPQPGANDNASGCAGVIELAQVFQSVTTDRSILFMCFSGEEQGLVGSRNYVQSLQSSGEISKVKLMLNMDMIGYDVNNLQNARIESNTANPTLISQLLAAGNLYAPQINFITSTNANCCSDHFYFLEAGVPTAFTWENGAGGYPQYHQIGDVPAAMTGARVIAGGIMRMNTAVVADYARAVELTAFADGFE